MSDIAVGRLLRSEELDDFLSQLLPGVKTFVGTLEEASSGWDLALFLHPNSSEFPLGLGVSTTIKSGGDFEVWLRGLARALSVYCCTSTICDGTPFGDTASPYWSLIWDNGVPILGYDLETTIGDGAGGPVKIIRKLDLGRVTFTPSSELANWVCRDPGSR